MADETNYSKRELDHYFKDITERLSRQDVTLSKILEQTSKTNGRVSKLEFWRNTIGWGFGVLTTAIIFILNYFK